MKYVKPEMNVFAKDQLEEMVEANAASLYTLYTGFNDLYWLGGVNFTWQSYNCAIGATANPF